MALCSLLPILGYALFIFIRFQRTISASVFISITFILSFLYLFGLAELLAPGAYILFYSGIVLFGYVLWRHREQTVSALTSVPIAVFAFACVLYLYFFRDAHYFFWDEYSHWGVYIKEMIHTHRFYGADSLASHLRYPPGAATWQYFVAINTGYSESSTYFAHFLLLQGSTLMLYERLRFAQWHWIGAVLVLQCLLFANFGHGFNSIYVDHVIGALYSGSILLLLVERFHGRSLWLLAFPFSATVLIKGVGLYFAVAALGFGLLLVVLRGIGAASTVRESLQANKKAFVVFGILLFIVPMVHASWNLRQELLGVPAEQQSVGGVVKSLITGERVISEKSEELVRERFREIFFQQQIHKSEVSEKYNEFSFPIMGRYTQKAKFSTFTILLFAAALIAVAFFAQRNADARRENALAGVCVMATVLIYLLIIYRSYFVAFGEDAVRVPSYVRYVNTGILPLLIVSLAAFLPMSRVPELQSGGPSTGERRLAISLFAALMILFGVSQPYFAPLYTPVQSGVVRQTSALAETVLSHVSAGEKIFIVFPVRENGMIRNVLRYALIPARSTVSGHDFIEAPLSERLGKYAEFQYVWFPVLNKEVAKSHPGILRMKNPTEAFTLYRVENSGEKTSLLPIL